MKTYLVGGAVRDLILGKTPKDRDYVVVGSTTGEMIAAGFKKANNTNSQNMFPIFLHTETNEEYALARKETKISSGKQGFETKFSPDTTLEEDLYRRDLTINAIAVVSGTNEFIDPYGGRKDLANGILRAVSSHFKEDPTRVLRLAMFLARFEGFKTDSQTYRYCEDIVNSGELRTINPVAMKPLLIKIMETKKPSIAFNFLREIGALEILLPEINLLFGIPQNPIYHPEGCVYTHVMIVIDNAVTLTESLDVRVAALLHDLGKGVTPAEVLPTHRKHEENGIPLVETFCEKFQFGKQTKKLALAVCAHHLTVHQALNLRPARVLKLLSDLNGMRDPIFFNHAMVACQADGYGKMNREYPQKEYLERVLIALKELRIETGIKPEKIHEMKVNLIKTVSKT
jgi:tRNA nucleotidyltransferase (CCA-adding enzyme)